MLPGSITILPELEEDELLLDDELLVLLDDELLVLLLDDELLDELVVSLGSPPHAARVTASVADQRRECRIM